MGVDRVDRDFPEELRAEAEAMRLELMEKAAEQSEDLMNAYLETSELTSAQIKQ